MVKVTITQTGTGKCALSGYEAEGLTAAFDADQPLFLSYKSFKQLVALRLAQGGKAQPIPQPKPATASPGPEAK